MTAENIIAEKGTVREGMTLRRVPAEMPVLDVLPRLLDAPSRRLGVERDGVLVGVIDTRSMLEAMGRQVTPRDDASTIVVETKADDFFPSRLAVAVEDVNAPLLDMLTSWADDGSLRVTLRVQCLDPTSAVRSLERYNFNVVKAYGPSNTDADDLRKNLEALNMFLNI